MPTHTWLPRMDATQLSQPTPSWEGRQGRQAAVCVLFLPPSKSQPATNQARLVLTRRTVSVRTHKGQISLPGGRRESLDRGPVDTALRETREELGIEEPIDVIGLGQRITSIDDSVVQPVLATTSAEESSFQLSGDEVDTLILSDWTDFATNRRESFSFNMFGVSRSSFLYRSQGHLVWGLTAAILSSFNFR